MALSAPASADEDLAPFGFLWAFAVLHHQVAYGAARASALDTGLTLAALAVMVLPASPLLAILAAFHVATVVQHLPAVYNHWYVSGLVSLTLLLAWLAAWWRVRGGGGMERSLAETFAPPARWCLLLLYPISGFHKLNADFFDPAVSCASVLYQSLRAGVPGLPDWPVMGPISIGFTILVELGVPVLLLLPRTRRIGVCIAILFHVTMALAGYPRFSAAGIALLVFFLPRMPLPGPALRIGAVAILLAVSKLAPDHRSTLFMWATLGLCGVLFVLTLMPSRTGADGSPAMSLRPALPAILGPVLILLSGSAPYLGLGTHRALGMYSNLRTEGGRSNHFLLPASLQIFSYQRDLVQVLQSSAPQLAPLAEQGRVIPWTELRARLTEMTPPTGPEVSVTYLRGGKRYNIGSASDDSLLALPVSRLHLKFLRYRAVEPTGPRRCTV